MGNKTKISSLSARALGNLLGLCTEYECNVISIDQNQQRSEALEDLLSSTLPAVEYDRKNIEDNASRICDISGLSHGDSIRQLLLGQKTDLPLLNKIKKYAKNLTKNAESDIKSDITGAVYYAAIASALVYHNQKISRLSDDQMRHALSELSATLWIPSDLAELFVKACKQL